MFVNAHKIPPFPEIQSLKDPYNGYSLDEKEEYVDIEVDYDFQNALIGDAYHANFVYKPGEADPVENLTVKIFAHLYEIADRKIRKEIEKIVTPITIEPQSPKKKSYSYSAPYYLSDSNFLDEEFGIPVHTPNAIQNMIASFTELFFGRNFSDEKNQKSTHDLKVMLNGDRKDWNDYIKANYKQYFQDQMEIVFNAADKLLKERIEDAHIALASRISFYAGLIITAVGYCLNQNKCTVMGLCGSLVAFGYMIKHYIDFSVRQMQHESVIKTTIDNIYYEAGKNRIF